MNGFLLDTNVVSELTEKAPDTRVLAFLRGHDELWLSAIVLHELNFGLSRLPPGRHRDSIEATLSAFAAEYDERVLPVGPPDAAQAAALRPRARLSGRVLDLGDALIAGTAKTNDFAVATRNVRDFCGRDLPVLNAWHSP